MAQVQSKTFKSEGGSSIVVYEPTKNVIKKLDQIQSTLHKVAINYIDTKVAPEIMKRMKELIWQGGSNMNGMAWAYWTKRKGEKNWRLVYPSTRMTNFTWSTKNKRVYNYPILPSSYRKYRTNRTKIKQGQFALFDTGRLITSFKVIGKFSLNDSSMLTVGSTRENILNAQEFGTARIPRRPVMQPVFIWFDNNTSYKKKIMFDIMNITVKTVKEL